MNFSAGLLCRYRWWKSDSFLLYALQYKRLSTENLFDVQLVSDWKCYQGRFRATVYMRSSLYRHESSWASCIQSCQPLANSKWVSSYIIASSVFHINLFTAFLWCSLPLIGNHSSRNALPPGRNCITLPPQTWWDAAMELFCAGWWGRQPGLATQWDCDTIIFGYWYSTSM